MKGISLFGLLGLSLLLVSCGNEIPNQSSPAAEGSINNSEVTSSLDMSSAPSLSYMLTGLPKADIMIVGLPQLGTYQGMTSQNFPMNFIVGDLGAGPVILGFGISFELKCEKSRRIVGIGYGGFGYNTPIVDNRFGFESLGLFYYLRAAGQFSSPTAATGAAFNLVASLTPQLKEEKCQCERITWEAEYVSTVSSLSLKEPPPMDYFIQISQDVAGKTQFQIVSSQASEHR